MDIETCNAKWSRAMNAGWFPDPSGQPGQRYFDGAGCLTGDRVCSTWPGTL